LTGPPGRTRFVLLRHGETDFNVQNRFQARVDRPLNATGIRQAEAAGRGLDARRWAAVCSSTLLRAEQTADVLAAPGKLARHSLTALAERDLGLLDGLDKTEYARRHPDRMRQLSTDPGYAPPGGESAEAALARFSGGLVRLAATVPVEPDQAVLVVAHGGVLAILARQLLGREPAAGLIGNCRAFSLSLDLDGSAVTGFVHHWDVEPRACEGGWPDPLTTEAGRLPEATVLAHT
jgi:probable phosphoglycerate mutase